MLADQYIEGIVVVSVVVCMVYIVLGVSIVRMSRQNGINVCTSAFLPVYQLSLPIRVALLKRKRRVERERKELTKKSNEESGKEIEEFSETDEIQL